MWKRLYIFCLYSFLIFLSLFFSFQFYYDLIIPESEQATFLRSLLYLFPIKIIFLVLFDQFTPFLAYFKIPDLNKLLLASFIPTAILFIWKIFFRDYLPDALIPVPIGVILCDFFVFASLLAGFRLLLRQIQLGYFSQIFKGHHKMQKVAIMGAGEAGAAIAADLITKKGLKMLPVIFLDDNAKKRGRKIHDIPIVGHPEDIEKYKAIYEIEKVIIAIPFASRMKIRKLVKICESAGLVISILPYMSEFDAKFINVNETREPNLNDILDRDPPVLNYDVIEASIKNEVVLVTGAGGSIGSELCVQILRCRPALLLAMDISEVSLFQVEQLLIKKGYKSSLSTILGDVKDTNLLDSVFQKYHPKIIFHAAAYKHVPIVERQPIVGVQNNFLGTWAVAEAARKYQAKRFTLISTDKAVNPTNVMGGSKRLCELAIKSFQNADHHTTIFSAVRFGNVIGSSGSAIPIFNQQIKEGGPITVTHPQIERYFMSIPEAVGLVLESSTKSIGGEIFVLNMGVPLKIVDVAKKLIELNGLNPDLDIPIVFTELRPGEKLYEEICYEFEKKQTTDNPAIFRIIEDASHCHSFAVMEAAKNQLLSVQQQKEQEKYVKAIIQNLVPQYQEVPLP